MRLVHIAVVAVLDVWMWEDGSKGASSTRTFQAAS
jgi:hypothetical protein